MAEWIECRDCPSPDCRGCNLYTLAEMLRAGRFDGLMDGNRAVHDAEVVPVRGGAES